MNLPPEILTLIFSHLDADTLKSCLVLSKDVRSLIINTPQLMCKLPVIFCGENWQKKIPLIDHIVDRIRAITFKNCDLGVEHNFVEIFEKFLRTAKNIEELTFEHVTWNDMRISVREYEGFSLPKLTKLSVDILSSGKDILKHLKNVKSLKMFRFRINRSIQKFDPECFEFVAQQNNLEILIMDRDRGQLGNNFKPSEYMIWFDLIERCESKVNIKFKLTVLEVDSPVYYTEFLANSLRKQSSTIQELRFVKVDFHYFRLVLNNFRNLKKLSLSANRLLNDARVQEIRNLRMPSVTELNILKSSEDWFDMKILLNLFPNLEMLTTPLESFTLHEIIEDMPKLRKLELNPCRLEMMCFAKNSSLQELKITNLRPLNKVGMYYWTKLAEDCPNIDRLTVSNIDRDCKAETLNADVAIILENLKHFKKLQFCELVNKISWRTYAIKDRSRSPNDFFQESAQPHNPNQIFRLLLERESHKSTKLSITNYFHNVHAQAIEKIVEEFTVNNEVVFIPDPDEEYEQVIPDSDEDDW